MQKFTDFVNLVRLGSSVIDPHSVRNDLLDGYCRMQLDDGLGDVQNFVYTLAKMSTNSFETITEILLPEDFHLEDHLCTLFVELSVPQEELNFSVLEELSNTLLAYVFEEYTLEQIENDLLQF